VAKENWGVSMAGYRSGTGRSTIGHLDKSILMLLLAEATRQVPNFAPLAGTLATENIFYSLPCFGTLVIGFLLALVQGVPTK
jgi:hypothetical protein